MPIRYNSSSNITKTLLVFLPLLAIIMMSSFYIMMDTHYRVVLKEEFTQKGHSDENNFGLIFSADDTHSVSNFESLAYYKKVVIPYNHTSGMIEETITQPKDDHIIGFYNQYANNTNYTTSNIESYSYEMTENLTDLYSETDIDVNFNDTGQQDISNAVFSLQKGVINGTSECTNMSFYPAPSLIWEDVFFNELWYEYWTPNASMIGKTFTRIYIPFKTVPPSNGLIYVQIYNATTTFSTITLHNHDIYNPSYSIVNVLESDDPFVYYGGQITIKIWTNEFINWWSPIQVATQSPRSTNSTMKEVGVILGIPFETNYPNKCFFKGWIMQQNFTSNAIYSEEYNSEEQIIFNLTFSLQDYGISASNLINFTLSINDLFHNLTLVNFIDGNVCFYNFNDSQFYNFANGTIHNTTYGLYYSNNSNYISSQNQILCQIVLRGHNQDFYMILRNLTFNMWYIDLDVLTTYYTTVTLQNQGFLLSNMVLISNYTRTNFGYIYTETITQHIFLNQTVTLLTPYMIFRINETVNINNIINREITYYLHNTDQRDFEISFNYYQPLITVDVYRGEDERVIQGFNTVDVFF